MNITLILNIIQSYLSFIKQNKKMFNKHEIREQILLFFVFIKLECVQSLLFFL
jgi:hypothetical protein